MAENPIKPRFRALLDALPLTVAAPLRSGARLFRRTFGQGPEVKNPVLGAIPAIDVAPNALTADQATSDWWAVDRRRKVHSWLQHPIIQQYMNRRISGDATLPTYLWFKQKYFLKPANHCLILGCGFGDFERGAIHFGIGQQFDAHDISAGAIEKARQAAADAGMGDKIEYYVTDLNQLTLPANTYDAVFIISAAHHILNLENLFLQCQKALKPGAMLFLDEYIGPSRFQSSPFSVGIINRVLAILPPRYRLNLIHNDGRTNDSFVPPTPEIFEQNDPSEAIRSTEIMGTLKHCFEIVEFRPYGGAILHMLFSGIMGNFDEHNETDVALLHILTAFEETLEKTGSIESDFAAIVARAKQL